MKTIYKFKIIIADTFSLEMPFGAKILKVDIQNEEPVLWALVNTDYETHETVYFRLIGTGHPMPKDILLKYVDTFQQPPFVWHLFKETK